MKVRGIQMRYVFKINFGSAHIQVFLPKTKNTKRVYL